MTQAAATPWTETFASVGRRLARCGKYGTDP